MSGVPFVGVALKVAAVALTLLLCLFADNLANQFGGGVGSILREVMATLYNPETQWMAFLCTGSYFVVLTVIQYHYIGRHTDRRFWSLSSPDMWLTGTLMIGGLAYALSYSTATQTPQALTLLAGTCLGRGAGVWASWSPEPRRVGRSIVLIVVLLTALLAAASFWRSEALNIFMYRGRVRWGGPWENPNIGGLLMGLGVVLASGLFVQSLRSAIQSRETRVWRSQAARWFAVALCTCAALLVAGRLLQSYSRGAWLAVVSGFSYLCFQGIGISRSREIPSIQWIRTNRINLFVLICGLVVLAFWQFGHTEHLVLRRTLSVGNMNDFSWRNRVSAWEGAFQMMADRPWFGFGWNQPEPVYSNLYQPNKLVEGMAIQMNDYFMVGMTLGLPALACFVGYIWLSFGRGRSSTSREPTAEAESSPQNSDCSQAAWLKTTCRAGGVVLLVGFWFDGGLFRLATAAPFWILLELGHHTGEREDRNMHDTSEVAHFWGLSNYWVPLLLIVSFVSATVWAKERDQFERNEFSLKTASGRKVKGIAVLHKPIARLPVVVYVHGWGGSLLTSGKELRQIAELGLAAVAIEYDQTNQDEFNEQFIALHNYLTQQQWAQSDTTAWVGSSLGAQRTLSFLLKNPHIQPQLLVRLSGGWITELNQSSDTTNKPGEFPIRSPILLVHGEKDETFPVQDVERLANLLRTQGVPVDAKVLADMTHGFGSDRAVVLRVVGEYCKSALARTAPFSGLSGHHSMSLWVYLFPAFMGMGVWFCLRKNERQRKGESFKVLRTKFEAGLRWLAWGLALVALGVTAFYLVTPELAASERTLSVARKFLVRPERLDEFDFLSTNSIWRGKPLKILLDHALLANYNRELVNWSLEEKTYRDFVLSPLIEPASDFELNWRRPLWESLYPRIRKQQTPESAAQIVVRHLRERITIAPNNDRHAGVESIWTRQIANEKDFEIIYVAALRSVGIPARLDTQGKVEFWTGSAWQSAPRPIISHW